MIWLGVPSGVDLWIFYDPDADGPDPAEWNHVSSHEVFYAGDQRPFSFSLAYEGSAAALEQTVIAKAAVNAYCPGSNSWRVLRAEDEVLLHVIDPSAGRGCGQRAKRSALRL